MPLHRYAPGSDTGFTHAVPSEITSRAVYQARRAWLQQRAAGAAGAALAGWAARDAWAQGGAPRPG